MAAVFAAAHGEKSTSSELMHESDGFGNRPEKAYAIAAPKEDWPYALLLLFCVECYLITKVRSVLRTGPPLVACRMNE
jgi:hypothetical protein